MDALAAGGVEVPPVTKPRGRGRGARARNSVNANQATVGGSGMQSMIDQLQSSPPPTSANSIVDSERSMTQDETHSPTSELSRSSSCASNLLDTSTLSVQERGRSANRVPRNASALFQNHYIAGERNQHAAQQRQERPLQQQQHGPTPCVLAPKLPPAQQRETVLVTTNVFPLEVENRVVYRYDVRMMASRRDTSKERVRDLCKGDRDDSEVTMRHHKCMLLLRRAMELYRILNEESAYIYDLTSTLFTNAPLDKDNLPRLNISVEQMTPELRSLMGNSDVRIEITPCTESAHTFNVADYRASVTSDLSRQDRSLRQFFEILTNSSALQRGTHYAFGCGKLFLMNGREFGLPEKPLNEGRTLVTGADKGIRFINGSDRSIVPALVLDSKKAAFFDAIPLTEMARRVMMKNDPHAQIPNLDTRLFREFTHRLNDIIRDLRLEHQNCRNKSFVASGLSDKCVSQIRMSVGKKSPPIPMTEYYRRQGVQLRPDLPAVRLVTTFGTSFFPMEILSVAPRQRVPLSKQTHSQMKDAIKECATVPEVRFTEIARNLAALDLDKSARFNPFMAAFGVRVSRNPLKVEGHRRLAPKVQYAVAQGGTAITEIDSRNANWRMIGKEYLVSAELSCWYIFFDDQRERSAVMAFTEALVRECRKRGIKMVDPVIENVPFSYLEDSFRQIRERKKEGRIFVMYIDTRDDTHDDLKLFEALYSIVTQHVHGIRVREAPRKVATLENIVNKLNCKNFGQCYGVVPESFATDKWISTGKTLIIGYDVCHPEPQPKHERRMKLPPTQPSVLGISFNGAICPETFIGDYSFQEPRKEQVTSSILEQRLFWIMKLFRMNRGGVLPETVIITRDGVSEGQFKMVMEEEVEAIRAGIRNFGSSELGIEDYSPPIVCIIACKRHNKRFAVEGSRGLENCLPMTVIDKDITRPDTTEFFMQAHKIIKGTGKLPAYTMPINEANLTMDEAQSLMMALCFTHQIVNQAISIPEPIYQADEWAKRGRNNFRAMLRRAGGRERLPMLEGGGVDWARVTKRLCYMDTELQLSRTNA
uniref:CSR-1 n=1 Tax=Ascaris suum TaxID=6253 RepID=F1KQP0_ASCSU|nr:CSR-1 [Ascaris suum]